MNPEQWLEKRTFHHSNFWDIRWLVEEKQRQGLTISLCLPTYNEEATVGKEIILLKSELYDRYPLLDEIAVNVITSPDVDGRILVVDQGKTGIPHVGWISTSTLEAIQRTFPPERERLFEWGTTLGTFSQQFGNLVKRAGLKSGSFKTLRASSATAVEAISPGSGWKHLGHTGPSLAPKHYLDPSLLAFTRPTPPEL